MPAVAVKGSTSTGHGSFPAVSALTGSATVFISGIPAVTVGDSWGEHCDDATCHAVTSSAGSARVFVNGKPLVRIGDALSCGDAVRTGSEKVFCG